MIDEDKTLLEMAAKAAGFPTGWVLQGWNPITDDGDALRLAVKLKLGINIPPVVDGRIEVVTFYGPIISIVEYPQNDDRNAAARRAIVRAAAEIGKAQQ
jgi:hypothetical protein